MRQSLLTCSIGVRLYAALKQAFPHKENSLVDVNITLLGYSKEAKIIELDFYNPSLMGLRLIHRNNILNNSNNITLRDKIDKIDKKM